MNRIVIGNLKMNLQSISERDEYLMHIGEEMKKKKLSNVSLVLCPPFVHLEGFRKWKNKKIFRGAQDVFWENRGSFTGEVSPIMIKEMGCSHVIIGHSERRRYLGETLEMTMHKMQIVLMNDLVAILCVGETAEEKQDDRMMEVISNQLQEALRGVKSTDLKKIIIAYEPVWSIGTGIIPSSNEVMSAKLLIKKILHDIFGKQLSAEVAIVYGGSVNAQTVRQVCLEAEMDGVLVGKESLNPEEFMKIAEIIDNK
jgi:triosephosphate isomerase